MPTCRDETSEAETAAATRRGEEKKRARCTRNYSDDNATLRMHPKRTDEASEFQKPLLTEIHCGESRSRFFIHLFFSRNVLPILPCYPVVPSRPATCVALFSKRKCTYTYVRPARVLHARPSDEMDTSGRKRRYTGKWYAVFIPRAVKLEQIPNRSPNLFSKRKMGLR